MTYTAERNDSARMDASVELINGALQGMVPELIKTEYPPYKFAEEGYLLPDEVNPGGVVGAGMDTITYQRINYVGAWRLSADYATVIEESDFVLEEPVTYGAKYFETKITYSSQELDRINYANQNGRMGITINLTQEKYNAVVEGYKQLKNKLFSFGMVSVQIYGLLTHPDVPRLTMATIPSTANTAQENIDLLDLPVTLMLESTDEVEQPDTLLMDLKTARALNTQLVGTASDNTVLNFWLENNGYVLDVATTPQNAIAGSFGQPAWLYYRRDSSKVCPCIPKKMTQIGAPQAIATRIEIYYDAQISGVHFKKPYSGLMAEFPVAA